MALTNFSFQCFSVLFSVSVFRVLVRPQYEQKSGKQIWVGLVFCRLPKVRPTNLRITKVRFGISCCTQKKKDRGKNQKFFQLKRFSAPVICSQKFTFIVTPRTLRLWAQGIRIRTNVLWEPENIRRVKKVVYPIPLLAKQLLRQRGRSSWAINMSCMGSNLG